MTEISFLQNFSEQDGILNLLNLKGAGNNWDTNIFKGALYSSTENHNQFLCLIVILQHKQHQDITLTSHSVLYNW